MAWIRTDDLDGSPAVKYTFGLDGVAYTLDAGEATRAAMRQALQPFLTVAVAYGDLPALPDGVDAPPESAAPVAAPVMARPSTPIRERTKRRAKAQEAAGKTPHSTIRTWANANGFSVGPKGRIPHQVIDAYNAAQQSAAA